LLQYLIATDSDFFIKKNKTYLYTTNKANLLQFTYDMDETKENTQPIRGIQKMFLCIFIALLTVGNFTSLNSMCKETSKKQSDYCVERFLLVVNKHTLKKFLQTRISQSTSSSQDLIHYELSFLNPTSTAFDVIKKEKRSLYQCFFKQVQHNYGFIAYCRAAADNPYDHRLAELTKTLELTTITILADSQTQSIASFQALRGYSKKDAIALVTSSSCFSFIRSLWEYYHMQKQLSSIQELIKDHYEDILSTSMKKKYGDNYKDNCYLETIKNLAQSCLENLENR
jgi:hypothetical protein